MAFFSVGLPWNAGEEKMQALLNVPDQDNPTSSFLTPQASFMLQNAPLLAIGTLDSESRPWTTLWGGSPGFSQPLGSSIVGTRTIVDGVNDPVVQALAGGTAKGELVKSAGAGKMVSGLAMNLMTRKRVKLYGKMIAASLDGVDVEGGGTADQLQLVTNIEQSLGNCPKYLNQYEIRPVNVESKLVSASPLLSSEASALIAKADMFFISSTSNEDMDTNHRGGPPGFVRVLSNDSTGAEIVYPEYSGNRLYQTLGNLQMNPKVGMVFLDFESGDVLYLTGTAEILVESDAATLIPGSNIALKIKVQEARYVTKGLPFRGERKNPSPYNPTVRLLSTEGNIKAQIPGATPSARAVLVQKTFLTPTISRFHFRVPEGLKYSPGQWVALDFSRDLNYGYSHMRDDDPTSLNDDFVRTFTISSPPDTNQESQPEFEMTIREVGPVTRHLSKQTERTDFTVPILGVGGEFEIKQGDGENVVTPYIAGGVGITPLLGQLSRLDVTPNRLSVFWSLRLQDSQLAADTFARYPSLAACSTIFLTGFGDYVKEQAEEVASGLRQLDATVLIGKRLEKDDLEVVHADTWYLCAGKELKKVVLGYLEGKKVVFEEFNY